jgi:hypothetical protein
MNFDDEIERPDVIDVDGDVIGLIDSITHASAILGPGCTIELDNGMVITGLEIRKDENKIIVLTD